MNAHHRAVSIRRATPEDIDAVLRLRLALLREYPEHRIYGRLRHDAEQLARPVFAAQLASGNEVMFLAEQGGSAIGIVRVTEASAAPFLIPDRYCYVSSAFVAPAHRRQGVLRRLLDRAVEWCRERGLSEMRLNSVGTREAASAAWESLGFEVVEQVRVRTVESSGSRSEDGLKSSLNNSLHNSLHDGLSQRSGSSSSSSSSSSRSSGSS